MKKYTWVMFIFIGNDLLKSFDGSHRNCLDIENYLRATLENIDNLNVHYIGTEV